MEEGGTGVSSLSLSFFFLSLYRRDRCLLPSDIRETNSLFLSAPLSLSFSRSTNSSSPAILPEQKRFDLSFMIVPRSEQYSTSTLFFVPCVLPLIDSEIKLRYMKAIFTSLG